MADVPEPTTLSDEETIPVLDVPAPPLLSGPSHSCNFSIGFCEDRNKRCRRTMEDSHAYFYDFANELGQGFFAIYDGHAGRHAADWCGEHLHEVYLEQISKNPSAPIPEILNQTFIAADARLYEEAAHSGCTVVVAIIRYEDRVNSQGVLQRVQVLYCANVGDARIVLSRDGKAIRMTYDHKATDDNEVTRIEEAGGFVMNNRVNGILAVTRSLGDGRMKEHVIGNPYTTETVLTSHDSTIILACDGLWDVCGDQEALDLIKDVPDSQQASDDLLQYALDNMSTDNLSIMVVKLHQQNVSPDPK